MHPNSVPSLSERQLDDKETRLSSEPTVFLLSKRALCRQVLICFNQTSTYCKHKDGLREKGGAGQITEAKPEQQCSEGHPLVVLPSSAEIHTLSARQELYYKLRVLRRSYSLDNQIPMCSLPSPRGSFSGRGLRTDTIQ